MTDRPDTTRKLRILAAAHAHTNLNIFAAIVSVLEGGHVYGLGAGSARRTADKIIDLCKAEQARQLTIFDRERARNA